MNGQVTGRMDRQTGRAQGRARNLLLTSPGSLAALVGHGGLDTLKGNIPVPVPRQEKL
jgi:hypothetical protein